MLRVKDLTCGYDSNFILHDITLEVSEGEHFGIIGPNGSGKTTLLRAITRLIKPERGEITFKGADIWNTSIRDLSSSMAVVSQSQQPGSMKVEEFVLLGRIPHHKRLQFLETREDLELARTSMALTGTLKFKDRLMSRLSGGERQLVCLARALSQQPQLLLLDEPITHLDITHQVKVMDLIKRSNKEFGITAITVLHDLNLASEYCDRLLLLNQGRVHKIGTPREVLTYQIIEDVYRTVVIVKENPLTGKPYIFLVPDTGGKSFSDASFLPLSKQERRS